MKFGYAKVGVFINNTQIANVENNAKSIINKILTASGNGVEVIVFPELTLTGVNLCDLYFDRSILNSSLKYLGEIAKSTINVDSLVFVGLPFLKDGVIYNTSAVINRGKVVAIIPKSKLNSENGMVEEKYFAEYNKPNKEIELFGEKVIFGNRIVFQENSNQDFSVYATFGSQLCREKSFLGANVVVSLSSIPEWVGKRREIQTVLSAKSKEFACAIAFANAGTAETGTDVVFSGRSYIYENGKLLSENIPFENGSLTNDIDLDYLSKVKSKLKLKDENDYLVIKFNAFQDRAELERKYSKTPFVPSDECEKKERLNLILNLQAQGLANRFSRSYSKKMVVGLSGGLDSTLALITCYKSAKLLGISLKDVVAITMPCFGTTSRTLDNSISLAKAFGVTIKKIDITKAVQRHLKDIKHPQGMFDVAFENAQARERTQVLMDYANMEGGLVVGTGDLSEVALGWSTYNGDHMSMFAVNSSIPKTLIRELTQEYANQSRGKLRAVLLDVLQTPVSPELLPPDKDKIAQKTEDIVGPYELHDFFLYHYISRGSTPEKLKFIANHVFKGKYSPEEIEIWLKKFFSRFITQQFKRSCVPEGVKTGNVSLSPRSDFNMPSDVKTSLWLTELE